jgi:hypothetical protein
MFGIIAILSLFSVTQSIQIGTIENNIIIGITYNTLFNLTRDQCICQMIKTNQQISALNYFQTNNTCQLFYPNTTSILIQFSLNSTLIFINQSSITITPLITSSSPSPLIDTFWSFDGDLNDKNLNYNSIPINNVSFSSPGITGYGSALYLNASLNQSVLVNSTINLNISFNSFTFQLWIYPFSLVSGDRGMIGQCESLTSLRCLHMTIRNSNARISFFNNSCTSPTTIMNKTWYHLTYVYNVQNSSQMIYINGILDCTHTSSASCSIFF